MSYVLTITPGVALRLKYARLLKGLKQTELAAIAGVSRATQLSYEAGTTSPNIDYLQKIQAIGIDVPFVLFGPTNPDLLKSIATVSHDVNLSAQS